MKLVYRSRAWKIILSDLMICHLSRRLQFIGHQDRELVKNIKTSYDHYADIYQMKSLDLLFALTWENIIDVYNMKTGELIRKVKWDGNKQYEREQLVIDEKKKCVYCILYCCDETKTESQISVIDCVSWKERIILSLQGFYAFDFQHYKERSEYIITGREFCDFPKSIYLTGIYKGIGIDSKKEILYDKSNLGRIQKLSKVKFMDNGDILYFIGLKRGRVYRLKESKPLLDRVDEVAFSHDGRYVAYVKKGKIIVLEYPSWEVVDMVESAVGHIYLFEFEDSDKHIIYKVGDENYLYEIEFEAGKKR